jgi:DNA-binding transcriptional regulator GbsR (MarR family)
MNTDSILLFSDHVGRSYAKEYGFPPVVGRLMGYLLVCEPIEQSIGDIADALLASRSAITAAIKMLETQYLVNRTRPAGSRADLFSIEPSGWERTGFDVTVYRQQANLAREGLEILKHASPERRQALEEIRMLCEFLAERMPRLLEEWHVYRAKAEGGD